MSAAQGGSAKTKSTARENGQPRQQPDNRDPQVRDERVAPVAGPVSPPPPAAEEAPAEGNETARLRPSLMSEAPPAKIELGGKKKGSGGSAARLPRKAHLVLRRVEPWSAMKFSFVLSLVCFVVLFVAVAVLYMVLSMLGVFDSLVDLVNQLGKGEQGQNSIPLDIASWFEPVRILGYTALIGAVNVVLITALSTLGAVIYNLSADLVGGVEVTFSEAE
ncbi:DUF3566 domain-containing protein [Nonomuraea longicatena]|uniref:DUF3566 domain-containing protein n=1 Tax=Nonomuraea longicatena TaxID=83682 RepID=A0ABN1NVD0_9ACTN